jgi:hypothetical protein
LEPCEVPFCSCWSFGSDQAADTIKCYTVNDDEYDKYDDDDDDDDKVDDGDDESINNLLLDT